MQNWGKKESISNLSHNISQYPSKQTVAVIKKCSVAVRFASLGGIQYYELIGIDSCLDITQNDTTPNLFMSYQFAIFAD